MSILVPQRPDFGPNRLDPPRVRPGTKIIVHYTHIDCDEELTITDMAYRYTEMEELNGLWRVACLNASGHPQHRFLSDMGVTPYLNGKWNCSNWAEVVEPC